MILYSSCQAALMALPAAVKTLLLFLSISSAAAASPCFTSLFSFGDSITDTGNQMLLGTPGNLPHCCFPPYGKTSFGGPTGRCSDGRLIVDFIGTIHLLVLTPTRVGSGSGSNYLSYSSLFLDLRAEGLGLPLLTSYPGVVKSNNFRMGANLAEGGATALDIRFLIERGIHNTHTNTSLQDELDWFKVLLTTICSSPSECKEYLSKSLILMGEVGGIDYNRAFFQDVPVPTIQELVPYVVAEIGKALEELIELGAVTILVPGNLPIGCCPGYLAKFWSPNKEDYDPQTGCLVWYNDFAKHHNDLLRNEIVRVKEIHPHTTIMYVDYYASADRIHQHPAKFGFTGSALVACCGGGGPYNYNETLVCGNPGSVACAEPSTYISWDDHHYTEAAYRIMAKDVLEGLFTVPRFNASCLVRRTSDVDGHSTY